MSDFIYWFDIAGVIFMPAAVFIALVLADPLNPFCRKQP